MINIGIGGSDLGPGDGVPSAARRYKHPELSCRFVSNVDGADDRRSDRRPRPGRDDVRDLVEDVHDDRDAHQRPHGPGLARRRRSGRAAVEHHFVAVSTNAGEVAEFGIDTDNMFGFWEWVGGRYSVDSAIGLSLMVAHRPRAASPSSSPASGRSTSTSRQRRRRRNAPVLLGLIGMWNRNVLGLRHQGRAAVRRGARLASRPTCSSSTWSRTASRCASTARRVTLDTGPIVWGEPGTNGQHAFYQLLHQGTEIVPADFIGFANPHHDLPRPPRPARRQPDRPDRGAGVRPRPAGGAVAVVRRRPPDHDDPGAGADAVACSVSWSPCTSTSCSSRAWCGASTASTSGASSSARSWPTRSRPELTGDASERARPVDRGADRLVPRPPPPLTGTFREAAHRVPDEIGELCVRIPVRTAHQSGRPGATACVSCFQSTTDESKRSLNPSAMAPRRRAR